MYIGVVAETANYTVACVGLVLCLLTTIAIAGCFARP